MTCDDCIHREVCYSIDSYLNLCPPGYLQSIEADKQCKMFEPKSNYMKAQEVIDYVSKVKSRILTSSESDCELYALMCVFEKTLNTFRLSSSEIL